jgi:hypothetical protein
MLFMGCKSSRSLYAIMPCAARNWSWHRIKQLICKQNILSVFILIVDTVKKWFNEYI